MREGICCGKWLRIEFHPSYLIMALGFVLTGYYLNLIIFTLLILVHEFGHYGMARVFGIRILKIVVYPYGGKCVLEDFVNRDLYEELLVAMSGVLMQYLFYLSIYFLYRENLVREYVINLFRFYNNQIIFFNLLPIYPLDGGRIVHLFLCFIFSYNVANMLVIFSSVLVIVGIFFMGVYQGNYANLMVIILLCYYLVRFYQKRKFLYHRFLLERYLYDINYSKIKVISNLKGMYRNRCHFILKNGCLKEEREILRNYFLVDK